MSHPIVILIGMSGVGKSTIGRMLSQKTDTQFVDLDHLIVEEQHQTLGDYILSIGEAAFIEHEAIVMRDLIDFLKGNGDKKPFYNPGLSPNKTTIIAPGGSLVYNEELMNDLQKDNSIVYLQDKLENILKRIPNLESRGIIGIKSKSLQEIYDERVPLYKKYATMIFDVGYSSMSDISKRISQSLNHK